MNRIYLITRSENFFFNSHLNLIKKKHINYNGIIIDKKKYSKKQKKDILNRINIEFFDTKTLRDNKIYYINHNTKKFLNFFKGKKTDFIFNLGTPRIFNKFQISNLPPIFNCHPGILPFYKGCNSPEWTYLNKGNIGATVHLMNEKIDDGKIIFTKFFKKKKFKNYKDFRTYIHLSSIKFYVDSIKKITESNNIKDIIKKKIALKSKNAKYWRPMNKINFNKFLIHLKNYKKRPRRDNCA